MARYIARRLLIAIPTVVGASILIFVLLRAVPGDVAERIIYGEAAAGGVSTERQIDLLRHRYGLDKPLVVQYFNWVGGMVRGDFGRSFWYNRPISELMAERIPRTLELAILTAVIAFGIAIPLGIIQAIRQDTWLDYVLRVISIGGLSLPTFWTGVLTIYVMSTYFNWLPPLETVSFFKDPLANLLQYIWPALILGYYIAAPIVRMTRSEMLEVIRQDYIRTAWAKGLRERVVVLRHGLKNALIPVLTLSGWWFGRILGGVVILESIFSLPGLGASLLGAVNQRDYIVVQTVVMFSVVAFVFINLAIDVLYGFIDPRVQYR